MELVKRYGFEAVSVEQVSHRAQVSVGRFLRHFPDVGSAVVLSFPRVQNDSRARFRKGWEFHELFADLAIVAIDILDQRRAGGDDTLLALTTIVNREPVLARRMLHELASLKTDFLELIAERLEVSIAHRRVRVIAAAFFSAVWVAMQRWARSPEEIELYHEIYTCAVQLDHIRVDV